MNIIIITRPDFFDGETALVNRLFRLGMQRLHLRKPNATKEELADWIEQIDAGYHDRIVLHDHHSLVPQYHLGGIHLNSRNPDIPLWAKDNGISISRSCHSLDEIVKYKDECNYLFLSPIYNSISKQGYDSSFTHESLASAHSKGIIDNKVIALGGVTSSHIPELQTLGFSGAAILGELWLSDCPEEKMQELIK